MPQRPTARAVSFIGTFETFCDVRSLVARGGKPDIAKSFNTAVAPGLDPGDLLKGNAVIRRQ
jgi:hypothetical protein